MSDLGGHTSTFVPRRELLKRSVGTVAGQRRRQHAILITKERRDAAVQAKRMRRMSADEDVHGIEDADLPMENEGFDKVLEENILAIIEKLKAASTLGKTAGQMRIEPLRSLRRLLSSSSTPPIDAVIHAGIVPILVDCLAFGSSDEQLLETAWCLTNIASGNLNQTRAIMPALPYLIAHLGDRSAVHVSEQCAWALGNVAGEGEEMREILLAQGALLPLGRLMLSNKASTAKVAAWALSNLIKGPSPRAAIDLMKLESIPEAIVRHIVKGDDELVAEVAWVVVYVTSLSDRDSEVLIKEGLLTPLISRLASSEQTFLLIPILRSIGNYVSGDNTKTDAVLEAGHNIPGGVLGALVHCLESGSRALQKEAAWAISNIAAGSLQHKHSIFFSSAVPTLLHLLATAAFDVRKEVAYALGNLCVKPSATEPISENLIAIVDKGCLPGFISLVKSADLEASKLGLQFLELVMRGLPNGKGPKLVERNDGIAAMEVLEYHENEELRTMANELIDRYFGEDYGLEEEYGPGITEVIKGGEDPSGYPPWRKGGIT